MPQVFSPKALKNWTWKIYCLPLFHIKDSAKFLELAFFLFHGPAMIFFPLMNVHVKENCVEVMAVYTP
jgi:hypothetical protein